MTSKTVSAPAPQPSTKASVAASAEPPLPVDSKPRGKPGGRLAPEVIQRIVRQNFGRFRLCYENGLRNSPNLSARMSVKFLIDIDGSVKQVQDVAADSVDGGVIACVVRGFYGLSFPPPEGGYVTVTYPLMFSPGG